MRSTLLTRSPITTRRMRSTRRMPQRNMQPRITRRSRRPRTTRTICRRNSSRSTRRCNMGLTRMRIHLLPYILTHPTHLPLQVLIPLLPLFLPFFLIPFSSLFFVSHSPPPPPLNMDSYFLFRNESHPFQLARPPRSQSLQYTLPPSLPLSHLSPSTAHPPRLSSLALSSLPLPFPPRNTSRGCRACSLSPQVPQAPALSLSIHPHPHPGPPPWTPLPYPLLLFLPPLPPTTLRSPLRSPL